MLQFHVIGNLGADARIEEVNGRKFVSFSVADSQRWTDQNGNQREATQWVSCALDGDGGNLLPHLKKGRLVYVCGRGSTRVYSSPKTHKFESGANISVQRVELLGGAVDQVPRVLYDNYGVEHRVNKAFWIAPEEAKAIGATKKAPAMLQTPDGTLFSVQVEGWITPVAPAAAENTDNQTSVNENEQKA